jgi:hypothetical protein
MSKRSVLTQSLYLNGREFCKFFVGAFVLVSLNKELPAQAAEYELEGTIQQTIFKSDGIQQMQFNGTFKVFVRDNQWLIETIEDKQFTKSRQYLKREIGSTNGAEIFEIVMPLEAVNPQTNKASVDTVAAIPELKPVRNARFNTATVVSNAVPVGQMDGSVVGHLWLMFASGDYLSRLQTNVLTPVYDVSASAPGNPNLKLKADWSLANGPASLPLKVTYLNNSVITGAVYSATGVTNVNGKTFPTGFIFEQYAGGSRAWVRKRAAAVVTAIRPACSLASLLPAITHKTVIIDRRLAQAAQSEKRLTYSVAPGATLPTVAEAEKANNWKKKPPKPSSFVIAVLGTTFFLPLVLFAVHFWKQRKKAG